MADADIEELRRASERARKAAAELTAAGGIVGLVDLPARWGIDHATAAVHVKHADFPEPIARIGSRPLWLGAEADLYRHTPRKPGPPKRRG